MSFFNEIRFSTLKCILEDKKKLNSESSLMDYINDIKDLKTRDILQNNKSNFCDIKLNDLKVYLLSGLFKDRTNEGCIKYSKLIVQDIDKIDNVDEIKQKLIEDNELKPLIVHKSASGKGLRAIYYFDINVNQHIEIYEKVSKYLLLKHSIKTDKSCKNIARLWCIAYDSNIYVKEDLYLTEAYNESNIDILINKYSSNLSNNYLELFEGKIEEMFNERVTEGNKHYELLRISCYAGAWVSKNYVSYYDAESLLINLISQTPNIKNLKSAYKTIQNGLNYGVKNFYDFNINSPLDYKYDFSKLEEFIQSKFVDDDYFFDKIKDNLPKKLKMFIEEYEANHTKDFMFQSLITAVSSTLPNLYFIYDGKKYYPTIFSLLLAPAAKGKGKLDKVNMIFKNINNALSEENKIIEEESKEKDKIPTHKAKKRHQFGANFSNAGFIDSLIASDEVGFIMDTESETLSNNNDKEWSNNSSLLRKLHSHEGEIILRKQEEHEFKNPKVAVLLTGTPGQAKKLFTELENGLFSRFAILTYNPHKVFNIRRDRKEFDSSYLDFLSKKLLDYHIVKSRKELEIKATDEQFNKHFQYFEEKQERLNETDYEDHGVLNRTALGVYKIATILTVIKNIENHSTYKIDYFDDGMFNIALELSDYYMDNSFKLIDKYSANHFQQNIKNENYHILINNLANEFTTEQALLLSEGKIPERTLKGYLRDDKSLTRIARGKYRKKL